MEENWVVVRQHAHDRLAEARALARAEALRREFAPHNPGRYTVGIALIRLGGWVLASGVKLPIELSRALATLRAVTDRSLRA